MVPCQWKPQFSPSASTQPLPHVTQKGVFSLIVQLAHHLTVALPFCQNGFSGESSSCSPGITVRNTIDLLLTLNPCSGMHSYRWPEDNTFPRGLGDTKGKWSLKKCILLKQTSYDKVAFQRPGAPFVQRLRKWRSQRMSFWSPFNPWSQEWLQWHLPFPAMVSLLLSDSPSGGAPWLSARKWFYWPGASVTKWSLVLSPVVGLLPCTVTKVYWTLSGHCPLPDVPFLTPVLASRHRATSSDSCQFPGKGQGVEVGTHSGSHKSPTSFSNSLPFPQMGWWERLIRRVCMLCCLCYYQMHHQKHLARILEHKTSCKCVISVCRMNNTLHAPCNWVSALYFPG